MSSRLLCCCDCPHSTASAPWPASKYLAKLHSVSACHITQNIPVWTVKLLFAFGATKLKAVNSALVLDRTKLVPHAGAEDDELEDDEPLPAIADVAPDRVVGVPPAFFT